MKKMEKSLRVVLTRLNQEQCHTLNSDSSSVELNVKSTRNYKERWFCNRPLSPYFATTIANESTEKEVTGTQNLHVKHDTLDNKELRDDRSIKNGNLENVEGEPNNNEECDDRSVISSSSQPMSYDSDVDPEYKPEDGYETGQSFLRKINMSPQSSPCSSCSSVLIDLVPDITYTTQNELQNRYERDTTDNCIPDGNPINYQKGISRECQKKTESKLQRQKETSSNGKKSKTKRIRQKDLCFYCETMVLNFARHLKRNHPCEIEVQRIFSKPAGDKERKDLLTALRKKGNFVINTENCERPVKKPTIPINAKHTPCTYCLGYYSSKQLWRHRKKCPQRPKNVSMDKSPSADAQNLLLKHMRIDQRLREDVFPRMRADEISLTAKKDPLICAFGARYIKIHREKHFINVTSRKMRELSRILINLRKLNPEIKTLFHALQPKNFDIIVEATKNAARYNHEKEYYESPTFAMNIGTSLKQCCDIAIMYALKRKEIYENVNTAEAEADLKTMIRLLESNWKFDISSQAADDLNMQKWNKVTLVPLAQDLKILKQYLIEKANKAQLKLENDNKCETAYNDLVESVFCRVLLLNRRRPGELQRLPLRMYQDSDNNQNYKEFSEAITPSEKILMQRFKRIVIKGKRNRGVPVLFSTDVQEHINILLKLRNNFIKKENQFFFARPNVDTPIYGYKVLEKNAKACGAKNPQALTATRLRKHLATLTQIFNMSENDIEQLATFMGHTTGIHRKSYRLPDDVYQTAKISKLLILMEKGAAGIYKGKSLEDIDVDLEENLMDDKFVECEDDVLEFDSNVENSDIPIQDHTYAEPPTSQQADQPKQPVKKGNKRVLVPWTSEQKKLVISHFKEHIRKKIPAKRHECESLINKYPAIFHNKNWLKMKVFVQNEYNKK